MVFFFFLFYFGISKKLDNLYYYNFFFDEDFSIYVYEIYEKFSWLSKLFFYVCVFFIIDFFVVLEGYENFFVFIFLVFDFEDIFELREQYYYIVMDCFENFIG